MSDATIYSIVGDRRHPPPGWLPGYRPVHHRRRRDWYSFSAGCAIGLGCGLLIGVWAHRRRNHD